MNDEDEVVELPTIEITDLTGMVYLRLEIEPSSNILKVTNDLQTVSYYHTNPTVNKHFHLQKDSTEELISIDYGEPFDIFVEYDPATFQFPIYFKGITIQIEFFP